MPNSSFGDFVDFSSGRATKPLLYPRLVFRRSSAVEQLTVNQLVVGSIPTAGAKNHRF